MTRSTEESPSTRLARMADRERAAREAAPLLIVIEALRLVLKVIESKRAP